jgi:carbonic anhydrase/acetyltransferase-like protein (isoleucine patch superfamily)
MQKLKELIKRIKERANINLLHMDFDVGPYLPEETTLEQIPKFCALCGLSPHHPLHFQFSQSCLAGSYFLDRCVVLSSVIYKSDIRGDELKRKGETFKVDGVTIPMYEDEEIHIKDSFLAKTLVHNYSHEPNSPETFYIHSTVSMPYANIHGSPVTGSFLGVGSTIDLTTVQSSVVGEFSYVQTGEMGHHILPPGRIWVASHGNFDFKYSYDQKILEQYVKHPPGGVAGGKIVDFARQREHDFELVFESLRAQSGQTPQRSALSPYAIIKGDCHMDRNVFVAQRAYLEDAYLGPGANAQENCFIIQSHLEGENVTAHGGKIINARMGRKIFVGFNSFIQGSDDQGLVVGKNSIIMPHTIIDLAAPLEIPEATLVWGYVNNAETLAQNSMPLEKFAQINGDHQQGAMTFSGSGGSFVNAFKNRIDHILEVNGAYFDGQSGLGHAQLSRDISFNIIQPFPEGELRGMYPNVDIRL